MPCPHARKLAPSFNERRQIMGTRNLAAAGHTLGIAFVVFYTINIAASAGASTQNATFVSPRPAHANARLLSAGELERVFWACDYAASTRGVLATPVATCSAVFDDLKDAKFRGDFDALVKWSRANKEAEHRRIGELVRTADRAAKQ
jgi:hypothetical protein